MSLFAAKYAPANQERQGQGVAGTYGGGVGGWQASEREKLLPAAPAAVASLCIRK